MKAKIYPRISLENRTKLETVIPLSTPFVLFVDPCNICNFKCKMCPNGSPNTIKRTGRIQKRLDFGLYRKIIDDLQEFDKPLKVLRMYKEGEPLLNAHFESMVRYAKNSGYVKYIDTTTNGYLLSPTRSKSIIESGIDKINISVNGISYEQFLNNSGIRLDYNKYVKNIANLYNIKENVNEKCEIVIKIVGDYLTNDEKLKFYDTFGDICDNIFIENIAPCWSGFDVEKHAKVKINLSKGIYNNELTPNINICPYIFYSMSVNSDGTVSLCFLDWQRKLIIGDTRKQSLKEIWNSDILYNYQMVNLNGKRKENEICKNCGQLIYGMPDNIDFYTDELKNKLSNTHISYRLR